MVIKILTAIVFWFMTLMLGFYIGKEEGRKEN